MFLFFSIKLTYSIQRTSLYFHFRTSQLKNAPVHKFYKPRNHVSHQEVMVMSRSLTLSSFFFKFIFWSLQGLLQQAKQPCFLLPVHLKVKGQASICSKVLIVYSVLCLQLIGDMRLSHQSSKKTKYNSILGRMPNKKPGEG